MSKLVVKVTVHDQTKLNAQNCYLLSSAADPNVPLAPFHTSSQSSASWSLLDSSLLLYQSAGDVVDTSRRQ
jgi:hypothetical protein